jgi:flagellar basal-body rod modification protein FlgD
MSNVNSLLAPSSSQLFEQYNTTPKTASSGASSSNSTTGSGNSNTDLSGNTFITLLVAQIQGQDPLNPMDPTQFVTQLVQFNQLDQLMQINQDLGNNATGSTAGSSTAAPTTKS